MTQYVNIALPKGRLGEKVYSLLLKPVSSVLPSSKKTEN